MKNAFLVDMIFLDYSVLIIGMCCLLFRYLREILYALGCRFPVEVLFSDIYYTSRHSKRKCKVMQKL